ncbi:MULTISPECIES: chitinase C-terminal domain-containing protein [unclassified Streptomyces]|uniref:chitinase C-terminal domain-containing protein n=1 Tax=unclassified Streptomyces TaxID=2593676 RepID=UPI0001C1905F|nr:MULTISPECIES: chitinase C-terminal domain-containing protein [unclassified Streptomyces]AEN08789.1 Chitinase [Streptomyces sp. SirexAA-E]MYR68702.1 chitinase [Streptomyces sp. SID4939]MYS03006.1 chitinase [Streptomyces sp. SID4940]MYT64122.1 chitinase [Streptomyces sp. SID8357]MYT86893.1 chitinase [Streptomyces sp. SID8360]
MLSPTRARPTLPAAVAAVAGLLLGALAVIPSTAAATPSAATADQESCRPDGLYRTPGVDVPYCSVYDTEGREKMGADHQRRVIGYFTSWRTGKDGKDAYLASDIPWDKVTHLNYAFAHVDGDNKISVGSDGPRNASTGMTWPGVAGAEMDPALPYKGHFNLLSKFKKQHPDVKTLVSVGGWAETGGYFDDNGDRVDSGGFYSMATNADGSVNQKGIDTFADSTVAFIKKYGFNGVDIDYEYPTTMKDAGNPLDHTLANARRAGLVKGYGALMKTLREKLDRASAADGTHYLLTVAAPSSGYLLRGMETFQVQKYLDYVNIMSYDLHGAWNEYVGPNASLFDDGKDAELAQAGVYSTSQYGGVGYLNTDWAYHYFRGSMPAGRINIGLPYYTRGFKNVQGGTDGLWGKAATTDCPAGAGLTKCGDGAVGIDNLWHDLDANGKESPAGSNPMWHAKNLEKGIVGDYVTQYGFPADTTLTGTYTRKYDSTLVAPWLWNAQKKVFLSTEDEQSVAAKADYVVDKGIGGTMIWELAGDYGWDAAKGQYEQGSTLTSAMYEKFKAASPYGATRSTIDLPAQALDIDVSFEQFALGDSNYPIGPKLRITNNTTATLPGGTEFRFDYATSAPANAKDQSGFGTTVVRSDHTAAGNVGGLKGDYNRVSLKLPAWQTLAPGASVRLDFVYYLPTSTPSNWTVAFDGSTYALAGDLARGTTVVQPGAGPGTGPGTSPSPDPGGGTCSPAAWSATAEYGTGATVSHGSHTWKAKWWTKGETPGSTGEWGVWQDLGAC